MRLKNDNQVYNLMNTNGRRSDVINAYTIYMEILNELAQNEADNSFTRFPTSLNQFLFYEEALNRSRDIFTVRTKYEEFMRVLTEDDRYKDAFFNLDETKLLSLPNGRELLNNLDKNLEARARHYTSNLTKIGFVYNDRTISAVGKAFVNGLDINKDDFEELSPLDSVNC